MEDSIIQSNGELLQLISSALQLEDPLSSQALLSYSFHDSDEWKLHRWRDVYSLVAEILQDFICPVKKVQKVLNVVLHQSETPYILSSESLSDVSRSLLNHRIILSKSDTLAATGDAWDPTTKVLKSHKRDVAKGGPLQLEELPSPGIVSSLLHSTFNSLLSVFVDSPTPDPPHSYHVKPDRRIPFKQIISTSPIEANTDVIVLSFLEKLASKFLEEVRNGHLRKFDVLSQDDLGPLESAVVPIPCLTRFLASQIRAPVTADHLSIFVWFLTFLSSSNSRPFECSLGLGNQTSPGTKFRALKISFDQSEAPVEVSVSDQASVLEKFADDMLLERIKDYEEKIVVADDECRRQLKQKHQEAALVWLKKKKMMESQVEKLQQQMLKVDEARQMRDATQSIGLVASVVETTVKATRASIGDAEYVKSTIQQFNESMNDVKEVQNLFAKTADDSITSESLEEEYERLMAKEMDGMLDDLTVPTHPLPVPDQLPTPQLPTLPNAYMVDA